MDLLYEEKNKMKVLQDEVEVTVLPDYAKCVADEELRNPLEIDVCPLGKEVCSGSCDCYLE